MSRRPRTQRHADTIAETGGAGGTVTAPRPAAFRVRPRWPVGGRPGPPRRHKAVCGPYRRRIAGARADARHKPASRCSSIPSSRAPCRFHEPRRLVDRSGRAGLRVMWHRINVVTTSPAAYGVVENLRPADGGGTLAGDLAGIPGNLTEIIPPHSAVAPSTSPSKYAPSPAGCPALHGKRGQRLPLGTRIKPSGKRVCAGQRPY